MPTPVRTFRAGMLGCVLICSSAFGEGEPRWQDAPPFVRAQQAFMSHDFARAEAAYRETLISDTVSARRLAAVVTLARISWRLRHDTAAADRLLGQATGLDRGSFTAAVERSAMLEAWGSHAAARAAALRAVDLAPSPVEREQGTVALAEAVIAPLLAVRLQRTVSEAAPDEAALRDVLTRLAIAVREAPGRLEAARLLVRAGALAEDGPAMLEGWRSYYLVGTGDTASGPLANARRILTALLAPGGAAWSPGAAARADLVHALADSRFFDAAAALALVPDRSGATLASRDPRAAEVVAYAECVEATARATNEFYRQSALGHPDKDAWRRSLDTAAQRLWPRLAWGGQVPAFDSVRLVTELDRRFGALVNLGRTAGYDDLHMGHRVVDDPRTVRQYGHEAQVRYVSLDAIVSNGFQSWAWDGRAAHGGWASESLIVQIRPGYAENGIEAWRRVTDSTAVRRLAAEIAQDSAADLERGTTDSAGYFPSVAKRLARDGRRALLDSLRAAGLSGPGLEAAFERELANSLLESSIFAHEGRHAIDRNLGLRLDSDEREYRAKLSEVALAPRPRLALGGIVSANIGDRTAHGQANARIMQGLIDWMRAHAGEIDGLDPSRPLLPQLPLLGNAQLRRAFASLDPLARKTNP